VTDILNKLHRLTLSNRPTGVDSPPPLPIAKRRQIHSLQYCGLCLVWEHGQCPSYANVNSCSDKFYVPVRQYSVRTVVEFR